MPWDVACACKPYAALVRKNHTKVSIWRDVGKDIHNISLYTSSRFGSSRRAKKRKPYAICVKCNEAYNAAGPKFSRMIVTIAVYGFIKKKIIGYLTNPLCRIACEQG